MEGLIHGGAYFQNFTVTQMLRDTLIRGRRTPYEVNVSGVLFSPFPETKKRLIAGYVRYDVIYHLFPINSQYICYSKFFISVNLYFSFVLNSLAYIAIPKNNGKIKINGD